MGELLFNCMCIYSCRELHGRRSGKDSIIYCWRLKGGGVGRRPSRAASALSLVGFPGSLGCIIGDSP